MQPAFFACALGCLTGLPYRLLVVSPGILTIRLASRQSVLAFATINSYYAPSKFALSHVNQATLMINAVETLLYLRCV
ncbi:hypothetical protein B0O99DRAFT_617023 [Bisporella sp. PMI_857]|nr:hypothetical protein B0O99DRAFT_617023 [Bisporella sp. PMI_857]